MSCLPLVSSDCVFVYITESGGVEPGILILSPVVTARVRLQCNGLKNVTKGLRDVKEGGISARKAGLLKCL